MVCACAACAGTGGKKLSANGGGEIPPGGNGGTGVVWTGHWHGSGSGGGGIGGGGGGGSMRARQAAELFAR
jgi:hypothetical protein